MLAKAAIFVVLAGVAGGQVDVRISGRVVDPSGAPIQDAAVRLKSAAHGAAPQGCPTMTTTVAVFTGPDGTFSFPGESRQTYELSVDPPPGFRQVVKAIEVGTGLEFNAGDIEVFVANSSGVEIERTVYVQGIGGTTAQISADDLAGLPQQMLKTTDQGTQVTLRGVLLADVFSKVATPAGEMQIKTGPNGVSCHSTAALYDVLVQAKDGSQTVIPWAGIDGSAAGRSVYLVTERDDEGPFALVETGGKDAKWVRQVVALTIRRAN